MELGATRLTVRALAQAARGSGTVTLHPAAWERIAASHAALERLAADGTAIYGVTTGLGAVADTAVAPGDAGRQRRVVLGRMVGVGPEAAPEQVRSIMLARLAGFAVGCSGASPGIVRAYLAMLNAGIVPVMPLIGSVGEADLAPLAHVAGVLAGAGEATFAGERLPGATALARAGIVPPEFTAKDGLALVSANAATAGLAALVLADAERLFGAWLAAAAISFESHRANPAALHPAATALRPAPGQADIAAVLLAMLQGGDLVRPGPVRATPDPLSLRCLPPVLGACLAALRSATAAVELELNASSDNPAILADGPAVQPNANFDATHLAIAFETLGLAFARAAALQGARVLKLMSSTSSGLPRFLTRLPGRSGFAPVQKTVASLVAEIGHAAMPMPACTLPAADGVEDYAPMAPAAVRKTAAMLDHLRSLCAIELLVAAEACDLRDGVALGAATGSVRDAVRSCVPRLEEDRATAPDIHALEALVAAGAFDRFAAPLFPA